MQRNTIIAATVTAAVLLVAAGFLTWRHVGRLEGRLADLDRQVEELDGQVRAAEDRAVEAAAQADEARRDAGTAAQRAEEATAREQRSAEEARPAEAARQKAEEAERLAAAARAEAERLAEASAEARRSAEQQQAAAIQRQAEALEKAEAARAAALQAQAEKEALQQRMDQELDRLQRALGRIADTRRTALGLVMTLDSSQIEFDFDKADLRPRNREVLSRIAGVLMTFENYGIQIFGHTDDVGTESYNQQLSERRAGAVRAYLIESGIDPAVLSTLGLGKSSPLVEGSDPESRQRNRRVELAIVFSEGEFEAVEPGPAG